MCGNAEGRGRQPSCGRQPPCGNRPPRGSRAAGADGLSLVELVIGLGLAGLLLMSLTLSLQGVARVTRQTQDRMAMQQDGQIALHRLATRVGRAGLDLDTAAGEVAFPDLPAGAGTDWSRAVAIQYRRAAGEPPTVYAYYLQDGRLIEERAPDHRVVVAPLPPQTDAFGPAEAGSRFQALLFQYFTHDHYPLPVGRLTDPAVRGSIRQVQISLELDRDGDGTADYHLQTAVPVPNVGP